MHAALSGTGWKGNKQKSTKPLPKFHKGTQEGKAYKGKPIPMFTDSQAAIKSLERQPLRIPNLLKLQGIPQSTCESQPGDHLLGP